MIASCSGVGQKVSSSFFYKHDLQITINNQTSIGTVVVSKSESYIIKIKHNEDMDFLSIETCHRSISFQDLKKEFTYTYVPVAGIEDYGSCPMMIKVFEKKYNRNAYAYIDFNSDDSKLVGDVYCNGNHSKSVGVSLCQNKVGLITRIEFEDDVNYSGDCDIISLDKKLYEIRNPKGFCWYYFKKPKGDIHRITTIGYEDIILKE